MFTSILQERVYGSYATVFHRTKVKDLANKVYTSGFKPGGRDMYGTAFYSTYEIASQLYPGMSETYGKIIVKFAVPLENFIFFDYEAFTRSRLPSKIRDSNESNFIYKQLDYYGIDYDREKLSEKINSEFSSEVAYYCVKYIKNFTKKCNGIVFTGRRDGRVLVCYKPQSIIPLSFRTDKNIEFTKVTKKSLDYLRKVWKFREKEQLRDPKDPSND